jgi:hypothetical protein
MKSVVVVGEFVLIHTQLPGLFRFLMGDEY